MSSIGGILSEPGLVDVAVARGASAGAAALSDDPFDVVVDRPFHDRVTALDLDLVVRSPFGAGCR